MEELLEALREIVLIHDCDWSDKYRETGLAADLANIARDAISKAEAGDEDCRLI